MNYCIFQFLLKGLSSPESFSFSLSLSLSLFLLATNVTPSRSGSNHCFTFKSSAPTSFRFKTISAPPPSPSPPPSPPQRCLVCWKVDHDSSECYENFMRAVLGNTGPQWPDLSNAVQIPLLSYSNLWKIASRGGRGGVAVGAGVGAGVDAGAGCGADVGVGVGVGVNEEEKVQNVDDAPPDGAK
ncbi:unnamed protein product [Penicillium pancosmium]